MSPRLLKLLNLALDSRTPENEALAAIHIIRKTIPYTELDKELSGSVSGHREWDYTLVHVRCNCYHLINEAGNRAANDLKLEEFRFKLLADEANPTSSLVSKIKFTFRSSEDAYKEFCRRGQTWIDDINSQLDKKKTAESHSTPKYTTPKASPKPTPSKPKDNSSDGFGWDFEAPKKAKNPWWSFGN